MRIHTNIIEYGQILKALEREKDAGRIACTVTFRKLEAHSSRTHKYAYEIQLTSWDRVQGDGRRRGNDGAYGAMTDDYAATYDEWGWLISAIYEIDRLAVFGSAKNPVYMDRHDFDHQTALTYNPRALIVDIEAHGDPYPYVRKGSTRVGREGSLRVDGDTYQRGGVIPRYYLDTAYKIEPRTAEWVRKFAHLDTVSA